MENRKDKYLKETVVHLDIKEYNPTLLIEAMSKMAFQARNLARAAKIYDEMINDEDCNIILTLSGSLFSAGLKKVVYDLITHNLIDIIISTGANIVDMDFFEALGFKHYIGSPFVDDGELNKLRINRIYDTFIDEDELWVCDNSVFNIANTLKRRSYSSREFIWEMGRYIENNGCKVNDSVIYAAYKHNLPIFVPAFSDCSAGFGLLDHQRTNPENHVAIDCVKDLRELVEILLLSKETGILIIGGGVPKNFIQDAILGGEMTEDGNWTNPKRRHKYAVQITVADERDGGLSSSTFKEASSWGKVDTTFEQMVYSEATITFPLIAGYGYHKNANKKRRARELNRYLRGN